MPNKSKGKKENKSVVGGMTSFFNHAFPLLIKEALLKKYKKEFENMEKYAGKIIKKQEIPPQIRKNIQGIVVRPELVFFLKENKI